MGFESDSVLPDPDPISTQEWVDSILAVQGQHGNEEARRLLLATMSAAKSAGVDIDAVSYTHLRAHET